MEKKPTTNVTKLQLLEETLSNKTFFHSSTFVKKNLPEMDQKISKIAQFFKKLPKKHPSLKKYQNIYIKTQFESPKHIHQTPFVFLKYLQQIIF